MLEAFRIVGSFVLEDDQVEKKLDNMGKKAQETGGNFDKLKEHTSLLGKGLQNLLTFVGAAAAWDALKNGIKGSVGAGIQWNSTIQQNTIAFESMLKSADKANDLLGQLTKMAADTPFEFPELADAAKKMLAFGFAAKDVPGMLTKVGDAAAGLGMGGEGVQRIITALGQMQAKTKVSAGEMMQLTEAGIPAWDILAKSMGKSTAQVMELSEKGLIPADKAVQALADGMEERFPNMMAKQSKAFAGLMSTLKDNLNQTFGQVMKPAFDWLSNTALPMAIDLVAKFSEGFKNGGLAGGLKAIFPPELVQTMEFIGRNLEIIVPLIIGFMAAMAAYDIIMKFNMALDLYKKSQFAATLATQGLTAAMALNPFIWVALAIGVLVAAGIMLYRNWDTVKAFLIKTWEQIKTVSGTVWTAITKFFTDTWKNTTELFKKTWTDIKSWWSNLMNGIASWFKGIWTGITTWWTNSLTAIAAFFIGIWTGITTWWNATLTAIANFFIGIWTGIIGFFTVVITTIVGAIVGAWNWISTTTTNIFTAIGAFFSKWWALLLLIFLGPLGWLIAYVAQHWELVKAQTTEVFTAIAAFFVAIWTAIVAVVQERLGAIKNQLLIVWNVIAGITQAGWELIKSYIINPLIATWNFLVSIFTQVINYLAGVWNALAAATMAAWTWIRDIMIGVAQAIHSYLAGVWNALAAATTAAWNGIRNAVTGAAQSLWSGIVSIFTQVKNWLSGVWNEIAGTASNTGTRMYNGIMGPVRELIGALGNIWNSIANGASGAWNGLVGSASGIFSRVVSTIVNAFRNIHIPMPHFDFGTAYKSIAGVSFPVPKVDVSWYAKGTDYSQAGYAVVGEEGPELLKLPGGSQVTTAGKTKKALQGLTIIIEKFINNRSQDVKDLAEELEFYRAQAALARGDK